MKYLGLDLGSRTLGVSMSDNTATIATSYKIIRHNEEYDRLVNDVVNLVEENNISAIVLGFPKNMDNSVGEKGKLSISFKEELESVLSIPVYLQDERLTTREATSILIGADTSRKKRKKVIDSLAATIILQTYLDKKGKKL